MKFRRWMRGLGSMYFFNFFLLAGSYSLANASKIPVPAPREPFIIGFDKVEDRYVVLTRKYFFQLQSDSIYWRKSAYALNQIDSTLDFTLLRFLSTPAHSYLVLSTGGIVYELRKDSMVRIDKSFDQRAQLGSAKFMMGDTIVSFGGYGFWNFQNFFTYFNPANHEWEMLDLRSDRPLPKKRSHFYSYYHKGKRDFFILKGLTSKFDAKLPSESYLLTDIWKINMTKRKWENLGTFNPKIETSHNRPLVFLDDKLIVLAHVRLYEIDFYNNKVKTVILNKGIGHYIQKYGQAGYNHQKKELIYVSEGSLNRPEEIHVKTLDSLYSDEVIETWCYRSYRMYIYGLMMAVGLSLAILLIRIQIVRYRRNKSQIILSLNEGTIRYNSTLIRFDELEHKLITELASEDRFFSTQEIFTIISEGPVSPEVLKKQKLKIVNSINGKISLLNGGKIDVFIARKSPEDKRQVELKLNREILKFVN
jgi:hypothetical protein